MDKSKFRGVFSALLTPYTKDDKINGSSVKKIIDMNLSKGINGFYVGGSTGEGMLLTVEERKELFRYASEANAKQYALLKNRYMSQLLYIYKDVQNQLLSLKRKDSN